MSRVEAARQQWEEGARRLRPPTPLSAELLEIATEELRKHVGETFTLAQLATVYDSSDEWLREAVQERVASPGWERQFSVVQDAAFHRYARGATDYAP
jgi:hypothetical protein